MIIIILYFEEQWNIVNSEILISALSANVPCDTGHPCSDGCAVMDGITTCYCNNGYTLTEDMQVCKGMQILILLSHIH